MPGTSFQKMILVDLENGEAVAEHQHPEHTVLYYPFDCDPVLVHPRAGMLIYLPPGCVHEVPPAKCRRRSVAMIVEPI